MGEAFCLKWNNHQTTLVSVFDKLFECESLVDCTLSAEGRQLKAHKVVLSACSPYLEELITSHEDKHPIIIFNNIRYDELKSVLDYMYRGEVNVSQEQLDSFLKVAECLKIKGLTDQGGGGNKNFLESREDERAAGTMGGQLKKRRRKTWSEESSSDEKEPPIGLGVGVGPVGLGAAAGPVGATMATGGGGNGAVPERPLVETKVEPNDDSPLQHSTPVTHGDHLTSLDEDDDDLGTSQGPGTSQGSFTNQDFNNWPTPSEMANDEVLMALQQDISNPGNISQVEWDEDGGEMASQHYCLRWNNYQSNMTSVFHHLLRTQAFVDVTLACSDASLKAHKVVLSACSSYFQKLLLENPCKHPTIIMPQDVCFSDLKFIIEFVYKGEIDVSQAQLQSVLKTADQLKIKGLCEVPEGKEGAEVTPLPPQPEGYGGGRRSAGGCGGGSLSGGGGLSRYSRHHQRQQRLARRRHQYRQRIAARQGDLLPASSSAAVPPPPPPVTDLLASLQEETALVSSSEGSYGGGSLLGGSQHHNPATITTSSSCQGGQQGSVTSEVGTSTEGGGGCNNNNSSSTSDKEVSTAGGGQGHQVVAVLSGTTTALVVTGPPPHSPSDMMDHHQTPQQQRLMQHSQQTDAETEADMAEPIPPSATLVSVPQQPSRRDIAVDASDLGAEEEEEDHVKVKFETLRSIEQADAMEMDHHIQDRASGGEEGLHTMMITPELLGLIPSSQSETSDSNSNLVKCNGLAISSGGKSWRQEDMEAALEALRSGTMSLSRASSIYGIPSTTLWQRAHRLGIETPKKDGPLKTWTEDNLNVALDALRTGSISANKASKAYGIPSSTLYKIARREGIRLAAPFNAAPTSWSPEDLERALESIRSGLSTVQRAAAEYGIPSGTLYGRCKREGIELSRANPTPWSEAAMNQALEAVRIGQMSINQAAIHFNLPYSSLYGRFKRVKYENGGDEAGGGGGGSGGEGSAGGESDLVQQQQQVPPPPTDLLSAAVPPPPAPASSAPGGGGPPASSRPPPPPPTDLLPAVSSSAPSPQIMLVQYQQPIHMYQPT